MKRKWIISSVLIFLTLLFALLSKTFSASVYLSLAFAVIFCIYFSVEIILSYIKTFYTNIERSFEYYLINLINSSSLTSEDAVKGREALFKRYKKSLWKDKLLEIGKILVLIAIIAICISVAIRQ